MHPENGILFRTKKNSYKAVEKTWKNCKCILLSERSPPKEAAYHVIPTAPHSGKDKTEEQYRKTDAASG